MKFVPLTRSILIDLQHSGYNILTSKNTVDDENPTWYPITVPDVYDYLLQLDCSGSIVPLEEPAILVIEDALTLDEEHHIGQVFIEDNYFEDLQHKIYLYDQRYQFISNPEKYDFAYNPEGVLMRNHAVHSGDHSLYRRYLGLNYPEHMIEEIQDIEDLTRKLICLDATSARDWFIDNDIDVMESDIWICDEDAILKTLPFKHDEQIWNFRYDAEELVYNIMATKDILQLRDIFWIDPRKI